MTTTIDAHTWIYVIVLCSGNNERIIGQYDTEHDIRFIPAYLDRNSAQQGLAHTAKDQEPCEIQAMIFEDLMRYAADAPSLVFVLDHQGVILSKIAPDGQSL